MYLRVLILLMCVGGVLGAQAVGDVLINEFCSDSAQNLGTSTGPDLEWVELFNTTGAAVDVSNWELRDNTGVMVIPSGTSIAAGGYLVVTFTGSASQFLRYTGWPADVVNTSTWPGLANGGDGLALFTTAAQGSICVDYIQYGNGANVPSAPTWAGTRPATISGPNDFTFSRVPNGQNADATPGDAGTEQGATSFIRGPFTPGLPNGGPVVDCYVPDEFSDHYAGGATVGTPIQTLIPRVVSEPTRMIINLPPGYNFNTTSSFGYSNNIAIRSRFHNAGPTVSVSYAVNGAETNISTSNLVLPANGDMALLIDLPGKFGSISGQLPNTPGTIVIDITCAINGGSSTTFKLQIDVDAPEITTSPNLGDVLSGQTTQVTVAASGGATPYAWSVSNHPAWISINAATGELAISPPSNATGPATFEVAVTDSNTPGRTDVVTFDLTVVNPLEVTTSSLSSIAEGGSPTESIVAAGGTAPYNFALVGAPAWLGINATTGALTGTAPASSAGTYNFDVEVSDNGAPQQNDSRSLSLTVVDVVTITSPATITLGRVGDPYTYTFAAVGGTAPYGWSTTGAPSFVGINAATGQLSGLPGNGEQGTYNFQVTVTDSSASVQTDSLAVTLVIDPVMGGGGGGGGSSGGGGGCSVSGPAAPVVLLGLMVLAARRRRTCAR